ncbi:MAG: hypothetical protein ACI4IQ_01315 [Eubacterium sp.]
MSENLSIDEIIKQAEEIRKKTVSKARSAIEEINSSAQEITERTIEIPKAEPREIVIPKKTEVNEDTEKTFVINKADLSSAKKEENSKTKIIEKQPNTDDKTGVINSVKDIGKSKKSFFNKNSDEPQYSKRPPEIIEKPATIKSKSRFDKTSDLEEIPTIVAVDELEKTRISLASGNAASRVPESEPEQEEGYQIVLDGFEDSTEKVSTIDEEIAEKQLRERRKDKINKFRLFSPDEVEKNTEDKKPKKFSGSEFESNDDKTAFLEKLFASKSAVNLGASVTLVLVILLGLLTFFKDSAYMPSFLLDYSVYFITMLVLYIAVIVVNCKIIFHGFNFKNGINYDFPVAVMSVIVLVHTVLLIVNSDLLVDNGFAYPFAASFALLMSLVGKRAMLTRIIKNFEFLTSQDEKHTVETIANQVDATIISRGLLTGDANLKTSIKTDFTTKFFDISCSDEPADAIAKTTGVVMLLINAVLFVAFSVITKNWHIALNIAVCGICVSCPCISLYITNSALSGVSRHLEKSNAMINGFEGARIIDNTNAIVIEAQDLFGPNSCEIHGIKTFNGAKADDVILKTAAVMIQTKSPLASVFDDVIIGKQTILPEVDGVVYEDRLGTSAWIYRKKILVGTRELLIHHGVNVPKEEFEKKYTRKGRKILYLAVTGKVMAMFVVSYNADSNLKKALRRLEKSGMTVLVRSCDPYINDESIAELFSLPDGFVRVMNSSNGRAFDKYSQICVEKSPAYVVHDGSALGFVSAMNGVENIEETRRILSVLISFGCAIGFGVVTLLGIVKGYNQLNPVNVVAFQAMWGIFMVIVSKLKRLEI